MQVLLSGVPKCKKDAMRLTAKLYKLCLYMSYGAVDHEFSATKK